MMVDCALMLPGVPAGCGAAAWQPWQQRRAPSADDGPARQRFGTETDEDGLVALALGWCRAPW